MPEEIILPQEDIIADLDPIEAVNQLNADSNAVVATMSPFLQAAGAVSGRSRAGQWIQNGGDKDAPGQDRL